MTPQFNRLTIKNLRRETADAVSIAFDVPAELAEQYRFTPGEYLTLRSTIQGRDVRRCYSISSGLDDNELRVTVKKVADGLFSSFASTDLVPGRSIDVMTPMGIFTAPIEPNKRKVYVAFAAGSGITPIMSILRTVLVREPHSNFTLFYGNRSTNSIIFRHALEDLKDIFLERLSVFHTLSRETMDVPLFSGRLNAEKLRLFAESFFDPKQVDHAFLCGPGDMVNGLRDALIDLGVASHLIHLERFTPSDGALPTTVPDRRAPVPAEGAQIVAVLNGTARLFRMGSESATIVDAAHENGIEVPYSCKGGMCCTCRAKLIEGEVSMDANYSLESWELEAGYILTCQARPTSSKVVIDYDHL